MNPIKIVKNAIQAIQGYQDIEAAIRGITDELVSIFTNEDITLDQSLANAIEECQPYSDHVNDLSLSVMHKAISNSNYKLAKDAIKTGVKEGANKICIEVLISAAITACKKCPDILLDALPQAAYSRWGFGKK